MGPNYVQIVERFGTTIMTSVIGVVGLENPLLQRPLVMRGVQIAKSAGKSGTKILKYAIGVVGHIPMRIDFYKACTRGPLGCARSHEGTLIAVYVYKGGALDIPLVQLP
jgi:hypothetical protein